jgi:taurine dioxygenase
MASGRFSEDFLDTPIDTIYGGSAEILGRLVAEAELGLPKSRSRSIGGRNATVPGRRVGMIDLATHHFGPRKFIRDTRERLLGLRFEHFEAVLQAPCLGAEIRGLDLREPLSDPQRGELERALVEFKVLFFRGQPVTPEEQAGFARNFGDLEVHPFIPDDGEHPEVAHFRKDEEVVGVENVWHSDVSWRQVPSLGSVLRARTVPPVGGDTLWCDMEAVFTGLPDELVAKIEGRYAIHDFVNTFGHLLSPEEREKRRKEFPPAAHPIVRTHPRSGRKCLYVKLIFR